MESINRQSAVMQNTCNHFRAAQSVDKECLLSRSQHTEERTGSIEEGARVNRPTYSSVANELSVCLSFEHCW